jgi:site-specific DNA recombinase
VLGGAPFGYRYVRKTDHAGAAYEIVEHEAALVAELFRRYADDVASIAELTRWLTKQGVPAAQGNTGGTAAWSGACCATPPMPAARCSARPWS